MTANSTIVTRIGAGLRLTEDTVPLIVKSLPKKFDPEVRGAIAEAVHVWACGKAKRPAVKVGRKGEQVTTDYGRGHDTLVKAVKRALSATDDKPATLRVSLSGDGGGSATVPADHALYAALVALIAGEE